MLEGQTEPDTYSFKEAIKIVYGKYTRATFQMNLNWFSVACTMYGVHFFIPMKLESLSSNILLEVLILTAVEMLFGFVSLYTIDSEFFGRRKSMYLAFA